MRLLFRRSGVGVSAQVRVSKARTLSKLTTVDELAGELMVADEMAP
jgi:hypothetical protein